MIYGTGTCISHYFELCPKPQRIQRPIMSFEVLWKRASGLGRAFVCSDKEEDLEETHSCFVSESPHPKPSTNNDLFIEGHRCVESLHFDRKHRSTDGVNTFLIQTDGLLENDSRLLGCHAYLSRGTSVADASTTLEKDLAIKSVFDAKEDSTQLLYSLAETNQRPDYLLPRATDLSHEHLDTKPGAVDITKYRNMKQNPPSHQRISNSHLGRASYSEDVNEKRPHIQPDHNDNIGYKALCKPTNNAIKSLEYNDIPYNAATSDSYFYTKKSTDTAAYPPFAGYIDAFSSSREGFPISRDGEKYAYYERSRAFSSIFDLLDEYVDAESLFGYEYDYADDMVVSPRRATVGELEGTDVLAEAGLSVSYPSWEPISGIYDPGAYFDASTRQRVGYTALDYLLNGTLMSHFPRADNSEENSARSAGCTIQQQSLENETPTHRLDTSIHATTSLATMPSPSLARCPSIQDHPRPRLSTSKAKPNHPVKLSYFNTDTQAFVGYTALDQLLAPGEYTIPPGSYYHGDQTDESEEEQEVLELNEPHLNDREGQGQGKRR